MHTQLKVLNCCAIVKLVTAAMGDALTFTAPAVICCAAYMLRVSAITQMRKHHQQLPEGIELSSLLQQTRPMG